MHGFDRALCWRQCLEGYVDQPAFAQLKVGHIAIFQVYVLVGDPGQGQGVASQVVRLSIRAHTQNQRGARTRANQAMRLVFAKHRNRISPAQRAQRGFDGFKQVAVVQACLLYTSRCV